MPALAMATTLCHLCWKEAGVELEAKAGAGLAHMEVNVPGVVCLVLPIAAAGR